MLSSLATLGVGCLPWVSTLALPPNRIFGARPSLAEGSTFPLATNVDAVIKADLHLNFSISVPTPNRSPNDFWHIECGYDAIPPGWVSPPDLYRITELIDCHRAVFSVTRGGEPLEPQTWTSQADWSYRSCGVFLAPGRSSARVSFPRIDVAEIAIAVIQKCVHQEQGFLGGWAAIGGYFIVLVTGRESSATLL